MSILVLYKPADAVQYTTAGLAAHSQVLELIVPRKIVRRVGRDRPHPLGVFEPERIDKLWRKVRLQDAVLYILLIIWQQREQSKRLSRAESAVASADDRWSDPSCYFLT